MIKNCKYVNWNEFTEVTILEKGICEGKICPIKVTHNGKQYVLKEYDEKMNYGIDYMIIDKCKEFFKLNHMNMEIIQSNCGLVKIDDSIDKYVDNCKIDDKECIYCVMDYWENIGDMRTYIDEVDIECIYECIKIIIFDGIFLSDDNIIRNILINKNNELLSIDENDLFGKTKLIFGRSPWCKKLKFRNIINQIVSDIEINKELIKNNVKNVFEMYNFDKYGVFQYRIDNLKHIINIELK